MFIHVLALHWKRNATDAQKDQAVVDIRALADNVPGIIELHVGPNLAVHSQGYELVVFFKFAGLAAFKNFSVHHLHDSFVLSYASLLEVVVLDLEI